MDTRQSATAGRKHSANTVAFARLQNVPRRRWHVRKKHGCHTPPIHGQDSSRDGCPLDPNGDFRTPTLLTDRAYAAGLYHQQQCVRALRSATVHFCNSFLALASNLGRNRWRSTRNASPLFEHVSLQYLSYSSPVGRAKTHSWRTRGGHTTPARKPREDYRVAL